MGTTRRGRRDEVETPRPGSGGLTPPPNALLHHHQPKPEHALLLTACKADPEEWAHVEDTEPPFCKINVEECRPYVRDQDVYYRTEIWFELSRRDPSAALETDIPGVQELSDDGRTLYWRPSSPLEPETSYEVELSYCGEDVDLEFSTSAYGLPLSDPAALVGRTYGWNPDPSVYWLSTNDLLLSPTTVGASELTLLLADESESAVDAQGCAPTSVFSAVDFSESPFFQGAADAVLLPTAYGNLTLQNATIEGTFSADGDAIGGLRLAGTLDARDIDDEYGWDWCSLADQESGDGCFPCPSDGALACFEFSTGQEDAERVYGLTLAPIAVEDEARCEALLYMYSLDLSTGEMQEPAALGDILIPYLSQQLLLSPTALTIGNMPWVGALAAEDGQQDLCEAILDFGPEGEHVLPDFAITTEQIVLSYADAMIPLADISLSGTFIDDRQTLSYVTFTATLDTRELSALIDPDLDPSAVCEAAAALGTDCQLCHFADRDSYCLGIQISQLTGHLVGGAIDLGAEACQD